MTDIVVVERLGAAGDGLTADGLVVSRTLPGEHVRVERLGKRARIFEILQASPERIAPPCPHFVAGCGGCAVQHLADDAYANWKLSRLRNALLHAGFADAPPVSLVRTPPGRRRRMDFALRRNAAGTTLGLHEAGSATIVGIAACPILHPTLDRLIAPLRQTVSSLSALGREGSAIVNLASGPDLLLRTDRPLTAPDRAKLAAFAEAHSIPRIAWAIGNNPPETAVQLGPVFVTFAGQRVEPAPGAFLQASAEGEAAIVAAVLQFLPQRRTRKSLAVELFAGIGTLSFALAEHLRVRAFEGDAASAAALRHAQSGTRVEAVQRDLVRQPLQPREFAGAAVIVLNPPFGGAGAQMPAVAASGIPHVIYVSCNPTALARDTAMLRAASYRIIGAVGVDQFVWSAGIEAVVAFTK